MIKEFEYGGVKFLITVRVNTSGDVYYPHQIILEQIDPKNMGYKNIRNTDTKNLEDQIALITKDAQDYVEGKVREDTIEHHILTKLGFK